MGRPGCGWPSAGGGEIPDGSIFLRPYDFAPIPAHSASWTTPTLETYTVSNASIWLPAWHLYNPGNVVVPGPWIAASWTWPTDLDTSGAGTPPRLPITVHYAAAPGTTLGQTGFTHSLDTVQDGTAFAVDNSRGFVLDTLTATDTMHVASGNCFVYGPSAWIPGSVANFRIGMAALSDAADDLYLFGVRLDYPRA